MRIVPAEPIVTNATMSGNITSIPIQLNQDFAYAVAAVWTGTPVGTLKLQASIDNVTYIDITGSPTPVSGPGNFMWNVEVCAYQFARMVYTATSGTGTLNAKTTIKGF